jgi:hypothetical protein
MIVDENWWRANEIVIRHLTRQTEARHRSHDGASNSAIDNRQCSVQVAWTIGRHAD